jgi:DNA polymerase-4
LMLWLRGYERAWGDVLTLPQVNDDQAVLRGLSSLWERVVPAIPPKAKIMRVAVTLGDLSPAGTRQLDYLLADDHDRRKWEAIGAATDSLNAKYGRTVVSLGLWSPPKGGNIGGKISFTRIPSGEDFW